MLLRPASPGLPSCLQHHLYHRLHVLQLLQLQQYISRQARNMPRACPACREYHNSMLLPWDYLAGCLLLLMGTAGLMAHTESPSGLLAATLRLLPYWGLPVLGLVMDRLSTASYQRLRERLLLVHRAFVVAFACNPAMFGAGELALTESVIKYGGLIACFDAIMYKVGGQGVLCGWLLCLC
jgi:hypothetical protein